MLKNKEVPNDEVVQEPKKKIIVEEEDFDFDFGTSNEEDLYKDLNQKREKQKEWNPEEEEEEELYEGKESARMSETTDEDEAYFKLLMGFIDNTRAMGFSLYVGGDMDKVKDYKMYKNWSDPEHMELLSSGRIVARKYKLHALDLLPEMMIAASLLISTFMLYKKAKNDKNEPPHNTTKDGGTPIVPLSQKMA